MTGMGLHLSWPVVNNTGRPNGGRGPASRGRLARLRLRRQPPEGGDGHDQAMTHQAGLSLGIPGYEDPALLGQGGFGSVYTARQVAFDRIVAIKILSAPGLDADLRRRFQRECQALGKLSGHPNIVAVYDSGFTDTGRAYIAMNYTTGGSLAERVKSQGPMAWQDAVEIGIKLAGALETAHRVGILHRDIKPENVLFSAYGEPELADFGSAAIQEGTALPSAVVTATLPHAAPEVLGERPASRATDVYSLASTVFTLMAGRPAFARKGQEDIQAVLARIVTEPVPDLRPHGVPDSVCRVIERAMEKQPTARQPRAIDLGTELQQAQEEAGLPVTAMRLAGEAPVVPPAEPPVDAPAEPPPPKPIVSEEHPAPQVPPAPVEAPAQPPPPLEAPAQPPLPPHPVPPPAWGEPVDSGFTSDTLPRAGVARLAPAPDPPPAQHRRLGGTPVVAAAVAAGLLLLAGGVALVLGALDRPDRAAGAGEADLSVSVPQAPEGQVGHDLTYVLEIANRGPERAREVKVTDALPSDLVFKDSRPSGICRPEGGTVVCRTVDLTKGGTAKLTITVTARDRGGLTHTVNVSSAQGDPRTDNNSVTAKVTVRRCLVGTDPNPVCY